MKFRSRHLFLLILLVAVGLAFLAQEPPGVVMATLFCCLSLVGIPVAVWFNGANFFQILARSIRHRELGMLSARIKWLMVDGAILIWLFTAISAANFVLENFVAGAKTLLLLALLCSPLATGVLLYRLRRLRSSQGSSL